MKTESEIKINRLASKEEGSYRAADILKREVDKNTLLLLSGGTSPDFLYQLLASMPDFRPGAVALVDERYGSPFHENSNEKMIDASGLFDYCQGQKIPVYSVLKSLSSRAKLTRQYNEVIKSLFAKFPKKIAIMGVGADGHTAGIAPNRPDFKNPIFSDKESLVASFDDKTGPFGQRVTLTFKGLSEINLFIVLAFGENKRQALQKMLDREFTDQTKIPAIFFRERQAILITDQKW